MPQAKIRIFWDLETCPPPLSSYTSPWEMLKDFRLFTSHYGFVTAFKAYWDSKNSNHNNGSSTDADSKFRNTTSSMGVDLVDCSSTQGYSRDDVTRRLTVDTLISAVDEAEQTNSGTKKDDTIIMILSGDGNILYAISLLMFRNYTVFLVVPDEHDSVQDFQATRIFKWYRDVWGFKSTQAADTQEFISDDEGDQGVVSKTERPSTLTATVVNALEMRSSSPLRTVPTDIHPSTTPKRTVFTTSSGASPSAPKASGPNVLETQHRIPPLPLRPAPYAGQSGWETGGAAWSGDGGWGRTNILLNPYAPGPSNYPRNVKNASSNAKYRGSRIGPQRTATRTTEIQEGEIPDVPMSVFDPLFQILRPEKRGSMGRSLLGSAMARKNKDTDVYKRAGVTGLAEYISLAVRLDLVLVGGVGNDMYVRLHPKFLKDLQ